MSSPVILLPGEQIPAEHIPSSAASPLRLGPGVRLLSQTAAAPSDRHVVAATQAGLLSADRKRNAISVLSFPGRRYIPTQNDLVIAQIHRSSPDYFYCIITPQTAHALLGQLAFEGATKKTRPMLKTGDLVYARVLSIGLGAGAEVELTCVNPATGRADPGGLGPLVGGMVFDVSLGMAARLIEASSTNQDKKHPDGAAGLVILEELGKRLESIGGFEIAVGRNGKVWVDCSNGGDAAIKATVAIGRCLQETEERNLHPVDQKKLASRILRETKIDA